MTEMFLQRLLQLRKEAKKTQEEMARIFNVQRSTYGAYEQGRIIPPYEKIKMMAEYFNVTVDYLMGFSDSRTYDPPSKVQKTHDVGKILNLLLDEFKDKSIDLTIDGFDVDDESRELLIASVENSIRMARLISERNKKG